MWPTRRRRLNGWSENSATGELRLLLYMNSQKSGENLYHQYVTEPNVGSLIYAAVDLYDSVTVVDPGKHLIPYMQHPNPTSLPMPRPRMALPRCASHVLGSSTRRRSSPGGRRSWGRGRGMPVCRSSCVHTWGTPFSCLQLSTMRRDPLHITHSGRHGACGHPAYARLRQGRRLSAWIADARCSHSSQEQRS